jgi:hypothetical protein
LFFAVELQQEMPQKPRSPEIKHDKSLSNISFIGTYVNIPEYTYPDDAYGTNHILHP